MQLSNGRIALDRSGSIRGIVRKVIDVASVDTRLCRDEGERDDSDSRINLRMIRLIASTVKRVPPKTPHERSASVSRSSMPHRESDTSHCHNRRQQ